VEVLDELFSRDFVDGLCTYRNSPYTSYCEKFNNKPVHEVITFTN